MFGYVLANHNDLSEDNKRIYRAYYCGLCQALKNLSGFKGQALLNYDMTFMVILHTGLYELENPEVEFTCPVHPAKKRTYIVNDASKYAADMNVLLAYYNLEDDWVDDSNIPKHVLASMLKKDYKIISQKYPRQANAIEKYMKELARLEENKEENIDIISGLTGEMLAEIMNWKDDEWAEELRTLGFYLGKFVYLMDAYEDLERDIKKNEYNPFTNLKNKDPEGYESLAKLILTSMMSECARSFERLPILLHADIIRNILYSGVWAKYEYLKSKKAKRKSKG